MTRTIPLLHPLDDHGRLPRPLVGETGRLSQGVRDAADAVTAATAKPVLSPAADLARYAHPHYLRAEPTAFGSATFHFKAFTGREPRPETPLAAWSDSELTYEQKKELDRQYDAARTLWSQMRLRLRAAPVVRRAAPLWQGWKDAEAGLRRVFAAFWSTPDGMWRAQLLKLTDAERAALAAARAWDEVAEELSLLAAEHRREVGEDEDLPLQAVAQELGLDASDWEISWPDEYKAGPYSWDSRTPMVRRIDAEAKRQRERLAEVARLAPTLT
ncbi:hypothetical protein ACFVP0_23570 [Streptomyces cinereoruber]|uniref:hypothetical protein n=1 Tax=Streptomyces cinereoruber TaxID=67260 RepID=UPI0036BDF601